MAIEPIQQRLDDMLIAPDATNTPDILPSTPSTEDKTVPQNDPFSVDKVSDETATKEEPIRVAGWSGLGRAGGKRVKDILAPMLEKGARAAKPDQVKVIKEDPVAPAPKEKIDPIPSAVEQKTVTTEPTRPVDISEVNKFVSEREEALATGKPQQAKPPEVPISSNWTDDDGLAKTINMLGEAAVKQDPNMSLRSIYMRAINAGVPENFLKRVFDGQNFESAVGESALAKNVAGAVFAHDESAKVIDDLMQKMVNNQLDDSGKLNLRMRLAQHQILVQQLKGIQTDVARTLNVFKRVQDAGPGLDAKAVKGALDELSMQQSDGVLYRLAEAYLDSPTRAGKNRVLEKGLFAKMVDTIIYTHQGNLLSGPETHFRNLVSGALYGIEQPIERSFAILIGRGREFIPGLNAVWKNPGERYYAQDIFAGLTGLKNGLIDGWQLAADAIKKGGQTKYTDIGKAGITPLSAEYYSDTPIRLFGQEVWRIPDLRDSFVGRVFDGLGFVGSIPFRVLKAGDELIGGMVARYQLHESSWTFLNKEYDRLIGEGMTEAGALAEVQAKAKQFLQERPADINASVESMRDMVTLQEKIDRQAVLGETYYAANRVLNHPGIKLYVPFPKTSTSLFDESSSYIPLLNFLSPRFYKLWQQGGKHRDVAIARISMGGSAIWAAGTLSLNNRVTGSGPSAPEDRRALENLGWQPYSMRFDFGELSDENIEKLKEITNVSVTRDSVYVSYARFDPVSMILAVGADMGDAAKFDIHNDSKSFLKMAQHASVAAAEYMSNLPMLQAIGELLSIARSRTEDKGQYLVDTLSALAKRGLTSVYRGIPGVGITNSTLMAQIERWTDPAKSNIRTTEMDQSQPIKGFYEARQKIMSGIPGVSKNVPSLYDDIGRPVSVKNRGMDFWLNYVPGVQATFTKTSELDLLNASINFGIPKVNLVWDGVSLSAEQENRYKILSGQLITEEVYTPDGVKMMNLEKRVPYEVMRAYEDSITAGMPIGIGGMQKEATKWYSHYRALAKKRMVGSTDDITNKLNMQPADVGMHDIKLEFPDLADAIQKKQQMFEIYGK